MRLPVVWGLILAVTGCAPPPSSAIQQAIVGGTVDSGDPAVMLLLVRPVGGSGLGLCTASLLSPHLLLTAAHCVDPVTFQNDMGAPPTLEFFVDPASTLDLTQPIDLSTLLTVRASFWDHTFDPNPAVFATVGHDLGAVVLSAAQTLTPLPYNTTRLTTSFEGQAVRVIGYGLASGTDATGATAGIKRQATITVQTVSNVLLGFQDGRHATCEGDSGGPALYAFNGGVETIVGITAFGQDGCPVSSPSDDTRIDSYADEIAGWITEAEAPPGPDGGTTSTGGPPATTGTMTPAAQAGCQTSGPGASDFAWATIIAALALARRRSRAGPDGKPQRHQL